MTKRHLIAGHNPAQRPLIAKQTLKQMAAVVDASGLVEQIELWEAQDRTHPGGRPPYLNIRATLILWLALAAEHQPMHIRRIEDILRNRLTPKTAALLGIRHEPLAPAEAHYERARLATRRIIDLFDAFPLPTRQRSLTVAEYNAALEDRHARKDELDRRARRQSIFVNQLLEATYQMLPHAYHPDKMSLVVDATRLKTFARGIGKSRLAEAKEHERVSVEPDHGFYLRTSAGRPTEDQNARVREYALEGEFAVLTSNDPTHRDAVPSLIVAYDQHTPGVQPGASALRLVESLIERGHDVEHFVGDQAYAPNTVPENLQHPLRALGIKLVMQYPSTESGLGQQLQHNGAIMVEGNWYCPSMAAHPALIAATAEYRKAIKSVEHDRTINGAARAEQKTAIKARWKLLIKQREPFLMRAKENTDARGKTPLMCPAAGNSPSMSCALKPNTKGTTNGRALLPVLNAPKTPGKVCTNKTSTSFDLTDEGKYGQYYQYGSDEWEAHYDHARSQVESVNAYVKDESTFALAQPGRRRMRGRAAQAFLQIMTLAAVNLQRIRDFLLEREERAGEHEDGITPPPARTRRSRRTAPDTRLFLRERRRRAQGEQPQLT